MENTRLLNELRQRTDDLSESLEQQTATSEVLKVISSSPGELELVFQAMLENATRLCDAKFASLHINEGGLFRTAAQHNTPEALNPSTSASAVRSSAAIRNSAFPDAANEAGGSHPRPHVRRSHHRRGHARRRKVAHRRPDAERRGEFDRRHS